MTQIKVGYWRFEGLIQNPLYRIFYFLLTFQFYISNCVFNSYKLRIHKVTFWLLRTAQIYVAFSHELVNSLINESMIFRDNFLIYRSVKYRNSRSSGPAFSIPLLKTSCFTLSLVSNFFLLGVGEKPTILVDDALSPHSAWMYDLKHYSSVIDLHYHTDICIWLNLPSDSCCWMCRRTALFLDLQIEWNCPSSGWYLLFSALN